MDQNCNIPQQATVATPSKKPLPTANHPGTSNELSNTITLTLPPPAVSTKAETQALPQPFKIDVDPPTDWPSVFATVLVGLAVAGFPWLSQRAQTSSSIAEYRHQWLETLRNAVISFIGATAEINYKLKHDKNFLNKTDSDEIFTRLVAAQGTILLMLDKKKGYTAAMRMSLDNIREAIRSADEDRISSGVVTFTELAQEVLESAWQDIKRDLKNGRWSRK